VAGLLQKHLAGHAERDAFRGAGEQLHLQLGLQVADLLAERRLLNAEA
jgi:hypothetical protein